MSLRGVLGAIRPAYAPVLLTYFCYGASSITAVALVFFEKDALQLAPAEVAAITFWVGLPWSMKMIVGAASDVYPLFGSRRVAYLVSGALCSLAGYALLAGLVTTKAAFLAAMVLVTVGFMIQDVIADALSVEVHEWMGISARSLALADTTISAPLAQLTMVPMLILIAKTAPPGAEATVFAIMASLMNLALSASELGTRYLNSAFGITQTS